MLKKNVSKNEINIFGNYCDSKIKEDYLDKFVSNSLTEVEIKTDTNIKYKISF